MLKPLNNQTTTNVNTDPYFLDEEGEPIEGEAQAVAPVHVQRVQAVAVPQPATFTSTNPLASLENAVSFSYKDGVQLVADKAGFQVRAKKTVTVGFSVAMEVVSWEKFWMVSPGSESAPAELVAYSNDGVNCNNPEQGTLQEHLKVLHSTGYTNARIDERVKVFGFFEGSEKAFPADMGTPTYIQLDLSPVSAKAWLSYLSLLPGSVRRGIVPADKAAFVKFTISVEENKKKGSSKTYAAVNMSCPVSGAVNRQLLLGN